MSRYMTEQRKELMNFLSHHPDVQYSAHQICEGLKDKNISLSAVYRNLAVLEKDGIVSRRTKAGYNEAFYQYTAAKQCRECIHLTCMKCGKTMHMDNDAAKNMVHNVLEKNGFAVDKNETVLYGICERCGKK